MITNFKNFNLITENPDIVIDPNSHNHYNCGDYDSIPFSFEVNQNHTRVIATYIGEEGEYHGDTDSTLDGSYPGRLWLDGKIISFWVYPNEKLFPSIIKSLEKELNIEIYDNDWVIEVIKNNDKIVITEFDPNVSDYYGNKHNYGDTEIIPIEDYSGSYDVPEEIRVQHLKKWQDKEKEKKPGEIKVTGFGSDKTAIDRPHNIKYRQIIYKENKDNK